MKEDLDTVCLDENEVRNYINVTCKCFKLMKKWKANQYFISN